MSIAMLLGLAPIPARAASAPVRTVRASRERAPLPKRTQPLTREEVLAAIKVCPSTVAELAGEFGVEKKAVGMHVNRLRKLGAVRECGLTPTGGRDATVWEAVEGWEASQ